MQRAEIDQAQEQLQKEIGELSKDVAGLTRQREALEQEHHRHSSLRQRFGKYMGFGAAAKLEWIGFKLDYKKEQLDLLTLQLGEQTTGFATLLSLVPAHTGNTSETTQEKMERMIRENPAALEPHLRQVYQPLIEAAAKT